MKRLLLLAFIALSIVSCSKDEDKNLQIPTTYEFTRDGETTVGVSGQWARIDMHSTVKSYLNSGATQEVSAAQTLKLISNDGSPFTTDGAFFSAEELNNSGKQIWNKVSASPANKAKQTAVYNYFKNLFVEQERISKLRGNVAVAGQAGIAGKRLVDEKGFEVIQIISKSLLGALQLDQIVNNYLSESKLDVENNTVAEGKNYTSMEHHWDEAFGYTGLPLDPATDYSDKTTEDGKKYRRFWAGYLSAIAGSKAGADVKTDLYNAFLKGRAAIVAKDYSERDAQKAKIQSLMSKACAIRAVHYFAAGAEALESTPGDGEAFHDIAEGIGFVYSLQFVSPDSDEYNKNLAAVVRLDELYNIGLYSADAPATIKSIAEDIAKAYGFTLEDTL